LTFIVSVLVVIFTFPCAPTSRLGRLRAVSALQCNH